MEQSSNEIKIYLEIGKKRIIAGAINWPGWCRSGRDEESALQALCDYGPRYASVLLPAGLEFEAPEDLSAFVVMERLAGDATTDYGTPGKSPSADTLPVDQSQLRYFEALLSACWGKFDATVHLGQGKDLQKGPRGGGRTLEGIIAHVLGAEAGYLGALGVKLKLGENENPGEYLSRSRQVILDGLAMAARGEVPAKGPRGGLRWTPRYFIRRDAWHVLDHAWEIEDRII